MVVYCLLSSQLLCLALLWDMRSTQSSRTGLHRVFIFASVSFALSRDGSCCRRRVSPFSLRESRIANGSELSRRLRTNAPTYLLRYFSSRYLVMSRIFMIRKAKLHLCIISHCCSSIIFIYFILKISLI